MVMMKIAEAAILPAIPKIYLRGEVYVRVDSKDYAHLKQWKWFPLQSHSKVYAARKWQHDGKVYYFRMHRQIMDCPKDKVVHHKNGNTLDNRRKNLEILTKKEHEQLPRTR